MASIRSGVTVPTSVAYPSEPAPQSSRYATNIGSAQHVVLLHLSRQCNTPERASAAHCGMRYRLTVTSQSESAPMVMVRRASGAA